MRFLRKNKINKTILIISDLHLGAGPFVNGKINFLEDFHYDQELVEFFEHFCANKYQNREVEIIINGDFLDFLAVPFVEFFDDEFWSEEASLARLDLILKAHPEVFKAMDKFLTTKKKSIKYIIGNHDAEFVFESMRDRFKNLFSENAKENFDFIIDNTSEYRPVEGIVIKHGHEYEVAHDFDPVNSVAIDDQGKKFFVAPWGSYYVTRVINKFKEERGYSNAVRPIKRFLINGLIYDTMFTLRFIFHTCYYFIMVRFMFLFIEIKSLKKAIAFAAKELELFKNYEDITYEYLSERPDVKALIVGHTHEPTFRTFANGKIFINTGTWTDMYHLDFSRTGDGKDLTFAQIDVGEPIKNSRKRKFDHLHIGLNVWTGTNNEPYREYHYS